MAHPFTLTTTDQKHHVWELDEAAFLQPASPLLQTVHPLEMEAGLGQRLRWWNGYLYISNSPDACREEQGGNVASADAADLKRRWDQHWFPQIKYDLDQMLGYDVGQARPEELDSHIETYIKCRQQHWRWYFTLDRLRREFLEHGLQAKYQQHIGNPGTLLAPLRLLQGFSTMITVANADLVRLANVFRNSPAVLSLLRLAAPPQLLPTLRRIGGHAEQAARALDIFLDKHGHLSVGPLDYATPTWREDPQFVTAALKACVDRDVDHDLTMARLIERRQELEYHMLAPVPVWQDREELKDILTTARELVPLLQDAYYWICMYGTSATRRLYLALGNRLVAQGVFENPQDIFFLWLNEVRHLLLRPNDVGTHIFARRNEWARQHTLNPPPRLGGDVPPSQPTPFSNHMQGEAAAPGVATGRACVIREHKDVGLMRPGDVLILRAVTPPWSALFITAAALVCDSGNRFSEVAFLARDYGLPAVMGTGWATGRIRSGQVVTVDGTAGTVHVVDAAAPTSVAG